MQMEDSDAEEEDDGGMDREKIANQLFDDDVSMNVSRATKNTNEIRLYATFFVSQCQLNDILPIKIF